MGYREGGMGTRNLFAWFLFRMDTLNECLDSSVFHRFSPGFLSLFLFVVP
jgi:hypothetical protein